MFRKLYQFALLFLAAVSCGSVDMEEFKDFQETEDVEIIHEENVQTENKVGINQEVLAVEEAEDAPEVAFGVSTQTAVLSPVLNGNPELTFFFASNPPNRA